MWAKHGCKDCGTLGRWDARSIKTIDGLALKSVEAMVRAGVRWTLARTRNGVPIGRDCWSWLIDHTHLGRSLQTLYANTIGLLAAKSIEALRNYLVHLVSHSYLQR